jgi:hypothetical protein
MTKLFALYTEVRRYGKILKQKDYKKENIREVAILYLDKVYYFKLQNGEIIKYSIKRED